jgi:hypothetical protein
VRLRNRFFASLPSLKYQRVIGAEQIKSDIASAREALEDASAGIDKMRKELKSLVDKVAKSEVRYVHFPSAKPDPHADSDPFTNCLQIVRPNSSKNYNDRQSTGRRSAGCWKSAQR